MSSDEISFKKNDTITVVAKGSASGFWEGYVNTEPLGSAAGKRKKKGILDDEAVAAPSPVKKGLFPNCFVSSNIRPNLAPTFVDRAMALFDYVARDSSELTCKKGDVIIVVRPSASPGWWCGYNESATKRCEGRDDKAIRHECGNKTHPLMFPTNFVTSRIVQSSFPFTARQPHELSFVPGEVIFIHRKWNDGWWEGSIGTRRGIFPSNYTLPNVATTSPPFFCMKCKTVFSSGSTSDCRECGKQEEIVSSMTTALDDYARGILKEFDLFAYVDLEPSSGGRSALLTVADTVDRSVRKEKKVEP